MPLPRPRNRGLPSEPQPTTPHTCPWPPQSFRALSTSTRLPIASECDRDEPGPDPGELQQLQSGLDKLRQDERDLKERVGEFDAEISNLEKKLRKRGSQRKELEQIMKELSVVQKFPSAADSLSQAEVVRAVEALNEEIFQLTAIVADQIKVTERHIQEPEIKEGFRNLVLSYAPLTAFLDVVEAKQLDNSLAIEIGWRAMLVEWCSAIIQAWVATDRELSRDLDDIYASIASHNDQAVTGKWRGIYFGASGDVSPKTRGELPKDLIRALSVLPVLCGYMWSHKEIASAFEQRIGPLLDKCLKLRKMTRKQITLADIRPYFFNSGERYNSTSADLDYEDDSNTSKEKRGIIACSLSLGLYLIRTTGDDDGRIVENREPILKPKVILQETLKEVITCGD